MHLSAVMLLLTLQVSETRLPIVIRCDLDTHLPLTEISVSLEEKPEIRRAADPRGEAGGTVTLSDLPEGDHHLLFYRRGSLLGKVAVNDVERGQFVRLVVRLVEGNAILLDELRVRGVSEVVTEFSPSPQPKSPVRRPRASSSGNEPHADTPCPQAGEPMTLRGKLVRSIDNDSFELQSGPRTYTVYIGTATHIRMEGRPADKRELRAGRSLTVKGAVAAGPEGQCSIGAREIEVGR